MIPRPLAADTQFQGIGLLPRYVRTFTKSSSEYDNLGDQCLKIMANIFAHKHLSLLGFSQICFEIYLIQRKVRCVWPKIAIESRFTFQKTLLNCKLLQNYN